MTPDLSEGLCLPGRSALPADAWTSNGRTSDELLSLRLAAAECTRCPVLEPCRDWAVAHAANEPGIIGGLTRGQRREARAELNALEGNPVPPWVRNGAPAPAVPVPAVAMVVHPGLAAAVAVALAAVPAAGLWPTHGRPCRGDATAPEPLPSTWKRCPHPEHDGPNPLPPAAFYRNRARYDGLDGWCRECKARYVRGRYARARYAAARPEPSVPPGFKRCPCPEHDGERVLPLAGFYVNRARRGGARDAWCKACMLASRRARRRARAATARAAATAPAPVAGTCSASVSAVLSAVSHISSPAASSAAEVISAARCLASVA
jgi:hypothetical protein